MDIVLAVGLSVYLSFAVVLFIYVLASTRDWKVGSVLALLVLALVWPFTFLWFTIDKDKVV